MDFTNAEYSYFLLNVCMPLATICQDCPKLVLNIFQTMFSHSRVHVHSPTQS